MTPVKFLFDGKTCNAAETVFSSFSSIPADAKALDSGNAPGNECAALAAAAKLLPDAEAQRSVRTEFVKLTGSADCAALKGVRCAHCVELACRLLENRLKEKPAAAKPRVMLLGDSIRMNYQGVVRRELENRFEVVAPAENCRFAKFALNELDRWFAECGEPEIIHWNVGLWDSAIVCREDGIFTTPAEYLYYTTRIERELEKHAKKVIFASTTPVKPGSANQKLEYVESLNSALLPWMKTHGVQVNDLYSLVAAHAEEWICDDCIHLNPAGQETVGREVAAVIAEAAEKL